MGMYLNPVNVCKETWLRENATEVSKNAILLDYNNLMQNKEIPIILMNNGYFTAAGICYKESEATEFTREDGRPKKFYVVPVAKLKEEFCRSAEGLGQWNIYSKYFEQ